MAADSLESLIEEEEVEETEAERCLYLCVECQGAFESIELCKQHMIQVSIFIHFQTLLYSIYLMLMYTNLTVPFFIPPFRNTNLYQEKERHTQKL